VVCAAEVDVTCIGRYRREGGGQRDIMKGMHTCFEGQGFCGGSQPESVTPVVMGAAEVYITRGYCDGGGNIVISRGEGGSVG
jgi:hypothetical protein